MSTILVVDDMPVCREPIAEALRAAGHEVICAGDGTEALTILRQRHPDLVLLDVNMPELDGLSVLGVIRRNPQLKDIPVIMLTDRGERESVIEAAGRRVQAYMLKSQFSLEELFERVEVCLCGKTGANVSIDWKTKTKRPGYAQWREQTEAAQSEPIRAAAPPSMSAPDGRASTTAPDKSAAVPDPAEARCLDDLSPVITKAELFRLVNKGLELRPLGPIVQNVVTVTGKSTCSAEDVAKAVTHDQAMSIRILKLANSSAYSRGRSVDSVKEAVQRIGVQEVRSLVMALGVLDHYEGAVGQRVDARLFWEHSIACGLIAAEITKLLGSGKADDSFLWGMVHDVGRLILLDHVADRYGLVWDTADRLSLPLDAVEAKLMLLDHCDILERALEHWQFPREFIAPVVNHHRSIENIKRLSPDYREPAATVALANRMAHAFLLGSSGNEMIYPLDPFVEFLKLQPDQMAQLAETIQDETRNLKFSMLARASHDSWPEFASQLKERMETPLHPLCVSAEPQSDAHRLFLERLATKTPDELPNVGVVYLRDARELGRLSADFDAAEKAAGAATLPVVAICAKGKVDQNDSWLHARRHVILATPVRLSTALESIQELLAQPAPV